MGCTQSKLSEPDLPVKQDNRRVEAPRLQSDASDTTVGEDVGPAIKTTFVPSRLTNVNSHQIRAAALGERSTEPSEKVADDVYAATPMQLAYLNETGQMTNRELQDSWDAQLQMSDNSLNTDSGIKVLKPQTPSETKRRKKRAKNIDAMLQMNHKRNAKAHRLLLLGAGESGKSTVLKQMRIINGSGFTENEREEYAKVIWADAIASMQILIRQADKFGIPLDCWSAENPALSAAASLVLKLDPIKEYDKDKIVQAERSILDDYNFGYHRVGADLQHKKRIDSSTVNVDTLDDEGLDRFIDSDLDKHTQYEKTTPLVPEFEGEATKYASKREIAEAIHQLWRNDRGIAKIYSRRNEFDLEISAAKYFSQIRKYAKPNYKANDEDIVLGRIKTTGVTEAIFQIKGMEFRMIDVGGQRSERRKWIHCFDDVSAVLFVLAVSEYDERMHEDSSTNRLQDSFQLFESIINSAYFIDTPIILFLNKTDQLDAKLERPNYGNFLSYYPEYPRDKPVVGPAVCEFFQRKCENMNKNRRRAIYTHLTVATDPDNMTVVMIAATDIILQKNLSHSGLI